MGVTITIKQVIEGMNLAILAGKHGINRIVANPSLSKPGLELAGMFDFYEHDRIQIIGSKEVTFFHWLNPEDQEMRVKMLFEKNPPAFVFSKNVIIPDVFLRFGDEMNIPVLKSAYATTSLFSEMFSFLQANLAERQALHGVLLDINGVGVLITGESGLGKSEVALELIRRGYMLVADDLVEVYQKEKGVVIGEAPELLKKYMEIRGIGIVNVIYLFGAKAYRETKKISLFVELETKEEYEHIERIGIKHDKRMIFDTEIESVRLPITEARNTATLVEAAAYDYKSRSLGYHSAQDFSHALNGKIKKNQNISEEDR
ncbi:MAG: HPr(Ser) kinase/phosphatase [Candidatus Izemoplasmatales bacterium]|jgi:HPr kinase/phosphorylase|nr:HPr(Ser) kinase/phosphatase [Candidatus Izemoplasmatales bacterium]